MGLIFITTLPQIRKKNFNLFYYTHLLVIAAVVVVCLHASTVFYCAAPGLFMWVLDWGMRLYDLKQKLDGRVISMGNGWYCLALQLPRRRLDGCACTSPLAHFYLYHSDSSVRQLHPFTTITHLASQNIITPIAQDDFPIQFLFRKQGKNRPAPDAVPRKHGLALIKNLPWSRNVPTVEWTDKLAGLADRGVIVPDAVENTRPAAAHDTCQPPTTQSSPPAHSHRAYPYQVAEIGIRAEGPYFTPADPSRYHTVICLVAGTGVSGAIALVDAFAELKRQRATTGMAGSSHSVSSCGAPQQCSASIASTKLWQRCVVIWSVKEEDYIELPFLQGKLLFRIPPLLHASDLLTRRLSGVEDPPSDLEVHLHLTGKGRPRLDMARALAEVQRGEKSADAARSASWVYIAGPNPFIEAGERACKSTPGVEWYGAKWDI
ncbi:MAG: hypothetical protein M1818_002836 [Claussenomyces sp. TS43310]|nr:MAG: hypothetical protein M1818_002836 [Claussenomyces sp. TS43310]